MFSFKCLTAIGVLTMLFQATPSYASDWRDVAFNNERGRYLVDYATIVGTAQGYRKAWVMNTSDKFKVADAVRRGLAMYKSAKVLMYFNCAERTSAEVQSFVYEGEDGGGQILERNVRAVTPDIFRDVAPDTVDEAVLEKVCGGRLAVGR